MEQLIIEATKSSPKIHFNADENFLSISGESYPENTAAFYQPVLDWVQRYLQLEAERTITLDIELLYFNSSSSKVLSDIFEKFEHSVEGNNMVVVNWRYHCENDMALEYGEEFQEDFEKITFNLIEFDDAD